MNNVFVKSDPCVMAEWKQFHNIFLYGKVKNLVNCIRVH